MATKIGDLYFDVSADTTAARESVDLIGRSAQDAGRIVSNALSVAFDAASFAVKTASAVMINDIVKVGAAFNETSQQAVGLFTALTGSLETATLLMRDFAQLSLDVPLFNPTQLQRTMSLLLTFDIAADQAFELSENINLAAIALARGQTGAIALARAIGQIQGRGWLEGDEARQLSEVGVNAYQAIADATGLATSEVIELGRESKLLAEDVIPILSNALEETFGPVKQNLINTYAAQVQGLQSVMSGIGSALVEPFIGRTTGGVLTDFLTNLRSELLSVVEVAEDGTFRLTGALESVSDLTVAISEGFTRVGDAIIDNLGDALQGGGFSDLMSDLAEAVPHAVDLLFDLVSGTRDFFGGLRDAVEPVIPSVERIAVILFDFASQALPLVADGLVALTAAAAPVVKELAEIGTGFLEIASPAIISILEITVDVLEDLAEIMGALAPLIDDVILAFIAWKSAIVIAEVATASFVTVTLSALSVALLTVAARASLALAALGAINSLRASLSGDMDWLSEDVPFYERPFQLAGQFGFSLGAGEWGAWRNEVVEATDAAEAAVSDFDMRLLEGAETFSQARGTALDWAEAIGLSEDAALHFANTIALTWREMRAGEGIANSITEAWRGMVDALRGGLGDAGIVTLSGLDEDEEEIDLLKELTAAAKEAWAAVDQLMKADSDATIDEFLRSLPDLAEDLTDAMTENGGILRRLNVSGELNEVREQALGVIRILAKEYGLSMDQIRAQFDERGLTSVIEILGTITQETTETIDPLILKYGELDATVDQLRGAVNLLEDQRTTRLQTQIDQVRSAIDGATDAAREAREAFDEFFRGESGGLQGAIDDLVLAIPAVGDRIEAGFLAGGAQGEAAIRQALGDVGGDLGRIFQLGLEQGLSPNDIIARLAPIYSSINEEVVGARDRWVSLDFTDGFTPQTAADIQSWMASVLDPGQIGTLFSNILGADANVSGLQARLDQLTAEMRVDVEFSPEQVQAAIEEIRTVTTTEPVVTQEAAEAIFDEIQKIFDDEDLEAAIDSAQLTDDILDAAKEAENQITLVFDAGLQFDSDLVAIAAQQMGEEFAAVFGQSLSTFARDRWLEENAGGPVTADAAERAIARSTEIVGQTAPITINAPITVEAAPTPELTAVETVRALGAAAGSGGRLSGIPPSRPR